MLLTQAVAYLQNAAQIKISYADIAEVLGISRQAVGNRVQRGSELQEFEWNKLQAHFLGGKIITAEKEASIPSDDAASKTFQADFYPDVFGSFISGRFVFSPDKISINIPKELVKSYSPQKKYSVIQAFGNSMQPSINDEDKLIIEHTENEIIKDSRIYVFAYDSQIFIKRLIRTINRLAVQSDSTDDIYKTEFIEKKELDNIFIIGRVSGIMRNI